MNLNFRLIFFLTFCVNLSFAQTAKDILASYSKEFAKPQYMKYSTKYMLYKGHNSKEVLESYVGVFKKNKQNEVYLKAQNNELITNKVISITISNTEKAIFLEKPRPYSAGEFDIKQLLPYFKLEPLELKNGIFKLKLISTPASGLPYSKIEVFINKKYQLVEQVFYFSTPYGLKDKSGKPDQVYPKLVVQNTNYSYEPIPESVFKAESYITVSGKKISSKLKSYKVYDKRERQSK